MKNAEPHTKRGTLRHGNIGGDPSTSPRCQALTRNFESCRAPGVRLPDGSYSRCRMHGGTSALRHWKHGLFAAARRAEATQVAEVMRQTRERIERIRTEPPT